MGGDYPRAARVQIQGIQPMSLIYFLNAVYF
jgi:hypothetical protein